MTKVSILLLEDCDDDQLILESHLKNWQVPHDLVHVKDRDSFESYLQKHEPDIIITDYNIPAYEGEEAIVYASSLYHDTPLIVISGFLTEERAVKCLSAGATDYVFKDNFSKLPLVLSRALDAAKLKKQQAQAIEELKLAQTKAEQYFDIAGTIILALNVHGDIEKINAKGCKVLGGTKEQLTGLNFFEHFIPDEEKARLGKVFQEILEGKIEAYRYIETPILQLSGEEKLISWHNTLMYNDEGEIIGTLSSGKDITARREHEFQLERFRSALDSSSDHIFIIDPHSMRFVDFNASAVKDLGYTSAELLCMGPTDIKPRLSTEQLAEEFGKISNSANKTGHLNTVHQRKDGSTFEVDINLKEIEEAGRSYIVASARDVSEQKHYEREIQRLSLVASEITNAVIITDKAGRIEWVNSGFVQLTGYHLEEVLGKKPGAFLQGKKTDPKVQEQMRQGLEAQRPFTVEILNYSKSGEKYWISLSVTPVFNEQHELERFIGVSVDITEKKEAEAVLTNFTQQLERKVNERTTELEEAREELNKHLRLISRQKNSLEKEKAQLQSVMNGTPDLIFFKDNNGVFLGCNKALEALLGKSSKEIVGKTDYDFFPKKIADEFRRHDKQAIEENTLLSYEEWIQYPDGSKRLFETFKTPFHNSNGKVLGMMGISRDITTRKESEERTQQALEKEKELGQLKSKFVSMASHQFRTPLATIQSNVELLKMLLTKQQSGMDEKFTRIASRVQHEVSRMTELMNDVLILGKLNAHTTESNPQAILVSDILEDLSDHFGELLEDGRTFNYVQEGDTLPIHVDKNQFTHVLLNLLSNAFKYSDNHSNPSVIENSDLDGYHIIQVVDQGIGIPQHDLNKVFQPFYRSDNVDDFEGTGLGLNIAQEYIELHGGLIEVSSSLGEGTTFTIKLPKQPQMELA